MLSIPWQTADLLGFDLAAAVAAYTAERAVWYNSEGVPAPRAHPIVEQIVREHGGQYQVARPVISAARYISRQELIEVTVDGVPKRLTGEGQLDILLKRWLDAGNSITPYVLTAEEIAEDQRLATLDADTGRQQLLDQLKHASAAQIDTWLQNNVTTLAQARTVLAMVIKQLARML